MVTQEDAINALGAVCEIAGFIFNQLQNHGFTREEAFKSANDYIQNTLTNVKTTNKTDKRSKE